MKQIFFAIAILWFVQLNAQIKKDSVFSFTYKDDATITVDYPKELNEKKNTQVIFYALPNGNTTAQTMGKLMQKGDDWHFDIQHIAAQTRFVREKLTSENIVVVYVENKLKSWPQWKKVHTNYKQEIAAIIDTAISSLHLKKYTIHLNGHSGGGAFIFGFIEGKDKIPAAVKRITFLDSNYGYDSSFTQKFTDWLKGSSTRYLTVFAYNDSVALLNNKPVVSATGGTWYRTRLMMRHFHPEFIFDMLKENEVEHYYAFNRQINIFLKDNPAKEILHTKQVELNGFIHSVLLNTRFESEGYEYYSKRAYADFIQ